VIEKRASRPMRMRFSSLRMPCTMRSAAASGVVRASAALGEPGRVDIAQRQHAALLRQTQCERAPEAAGGTGDDGDGAGEGAHR
jgi:hypothetical protein